MTDGPSSGELPLISKLEVPVTPNKTEVKTPEVKTPDLAEQKIIDRIDRDGDPDLVLQDLAKTVVSSNSSGLTTTEKPLEVLTAKPSTQTVETPVVETQNFDEQAFKKVEKKILVLQQYLKSLGPDNPKTKALAEEIYSQGELISNALQTDQYFAPLIKKLGLLVSKGAKVKGMREFVQRITTKNASRIEEGLQNNNPEEVISSCLELFTNCIYGDYDDPNPITNNRLGIETGITALQKHLDAVQKGLRDELPNFNSIAMLRKILVYGDSQFSDQVVSIMQQIIRDRQPKIESMQLNENNLGVVEQDRDIVLFNQLLTHADSDLIERVKPLVGAKISSLGIDTTDTVEAWAESAPRHKFGEVVENNIVAATSLEQQRPGIVKLLREKYGINDFGRYPVGILVQQYDDAMNLEKPYGVIINPRSDENGGFYQDAELFNNLAQQLDGKYGIRIIECRNALEIVRTMNSLRKTYGPASFAIVGGHGTPENITFGSDRNHKIQKEDLQRKGAQAISLAFTEDAPIIFNSCLTGQPEGIAQQSSRLHKGEVIAPDVRTSIKSLAVSIDEQGKLLFRVEYEDEGVQRRYSRGISV